MSWVFKISIDGATGTGKTSILNSTCINNFEKDYSKIIGFNFFSKVFDLDSGESCKLQLWDINRDFRFHNHHIFGGSSALFLFFDVNDPKSFQKLPELIENFRLKTRFGPIHLIGSKADLDRKISSNEIEDLINLFDLKGPHYISLKNPLSFEILLLDVIQDLTQAEHIETLSQEELESFNLFFSYFNNCPICGRENHKSYLKRFYFSKDPREQAIKQRLIDLVEGNIDYRNINEICIGIPCCQCHSTLFEASS